MVEPGYNKVEIGTLLTFVAPRFPFEELVKLLAALVFLPVSTLRVVVGATPMLLAKRGCRNSDRLHAAKRCKRKAFLQKSGQLERRKMQLRAVLLVKVTGV